LLLTMALLALLPLPPELMLLPPLALLLVRAG
jgi:hypothetical protein